MSTTHNQDLLVYTLVGIVVFAFALIPLARKFFKKYPVCVAAGEPEKIRSIIGWALKNRETQQRLLVTFAVMLLVYFLEWIPIPGLQGKPQGLGLLIDTFQLPQLSLVVVGIAPFLLVCGFLQICSGFIPPLRRWMFASASGRRKLLRLTYALTLLVAALLAFQQSRLFYEFFTFTLFKGKIPAILFMSLSLTAAVFLLLGLAEVVNRHGLGNGIALVFLTPFLNKIFFAVRGLNAWHADSNLLVVLLSFVLLAVIMILLAFRFTRSRELLSVVNHGTGESLQVPLRITFPGTQPPIWASSLLLFPATLSQFWPDSFLTPFSYFVSLGWRNWVLFWLITLFIVFIFSKLVFSRAHLADLLERTGFSHLVEWNFRRLVLITGIFLLLVLGVEELVISFLNEPPSVADVFLGITMLALVGYVHDLLAHAEFFRRRAASGRVDWRLCETLLAEDDAFIKAESLKGRGIPALVEPIPFNWGMPMRTVVDQYRIYCPEEFVEQAMGILENTALIRGDSSSKQGALAPPERANA